MFVFFSINIPTNDNQNNVPNINIKLKAITYYIVINGIYCL